MGQDHNGITATPVAVNRAPWLGSVKGQEPPNKDRKYPAQPLTRQEANALIRAALAGPGWTGLRNAALITVMYRGGLRVAEALALRPADVDLARCTARVLHGKGNKSRVVHTGAAAAGLIGRWLAVRDQLVPSAPTLFCTRAGGPVSDRYVRLMMKRLGLAAGIEKRVHPHGLRHTHADELSWSGTPIGVISKQLGHSSSAVTARYLDHISNPDVALWVDRLDWEVPA